MALATLPRIAVAAAPSFEVFCAGGAGLRVFGAVGRLVADGVAAGRLAVFFRAVLFTAGRRAGVVFFFAAVLRAVCFRVGFFAKLTSDRINARQMPVRIRVLNQPSRFA